MRANCVYVLLCSLLAALKSSGGCGLLQLEFISAEAKIETSLVNAHCWSQQDEARLREVIEAGGKEVFEQHIRDLANLIS